MSIKSRESEAERKYMRFKLFLLFLIILSGVIFLFRNEALNFYYNFSQKLPEIEKKTSNFLLENLEKEVVAPPPLRTQKEDPQSFLTRAGTIQWANFYREKEGLLSLSENLKLNSAAEEKLEDMFKNQYFEHISPLGLGAGDFAESKDYEFIVIGENLALGDFGNDQELVQAWMDSPGHRANILNPRYQDIGVAVARDLFEGKSRWLAVQIFGKPLSACPQPDENVRLKIEIFESQIGELKIEIDSLLKEIRNMRPKRGPAYNDKVVEYNELVNQYNSLVGESKILINQYNLQAGLFNECATE